MYSPTHTRFGPFLVGGILACNLTLQQVTKSTKRTILGNIMLSLFTFLSVTQILIPCFPPEDTAPLVAQIIATVAIRTLAAISVAFLLYRTLLPSSHPWSWPSVLYFESGYNLLKAILVPISKLSYCSYLLHFRILMELAFQPVTHQFLLQLSKNKLPGIALEPKGRIENSDEGIIYLRYLFIFGFIISLFLSYLLYNFIEKPAHKYAHEIFESKSKSKRN
jgi:peptidoglycan/LPS O-acetylase OafA/YrhL